MKKGASSLGGWNTAYIGVEEAEELKRTAVRRGLINERTGEPKSWMAAVVMMLRGYSSHEGFNHEWWGAQTFVPDWAWRLEEHYGDGWLYYPKDGDDLRPRKLGARFGFQMTISERSIEMAQEDPELLEMWFDTEEENARNIGKGERQKVRTKIIGFNSFESYLEESCKTAREFRVAVFAMASSKADAEEFTEFTAGFARGAVEALKTDLRGREFLERRAVVGIILEHSIEIDALLDRTQINRFILSQLPSTWAASVAKGEQWISFSERMRDIYEKIGLKKAGRGRPRKNREIEER